MSDPYRYVTPIARREATGPVAAVYRQSVAELGAVFSPHLSPAPEVLAATWVALREAEVAGRAPRARKEAAAAAVAMANGCAFCVDAHVGLVHAAGAHRLAEAIVHGSAPEDPQDATVVAWAAATRTPEARAARRVPVPADVAAEYVGTVLVNHFINRLVEVLRPGGLLPSNPVLARGARLAAGAALSGRTRRTHEPGEGLPLVADLPRAAVPAWAGRGPVGEAFAVFSAAAGTGAALLGPAARAAVRARVAAWDGGHPPVGGGWLEEALMGVPARDLPAARLALLAALAPHRVTDAHVAAWRLVEPEDGELVRLLAYGAFTAVARIESAIAPRVPVPAGTAA